MRGEELTGTLSFWVNGRISSMSCSFFVSHKNTSCPTQPQDDTWALVTLSEAKGLAVHVTMRCSHLGLDCVLRFEIGSHGLIFGFRDFTAGIAPLQNFDGRV